MLAKQINVSISESIPILLAWSNKIYETQFIPDFIVKAMISKTVDHAWWTSDVKCSCSLSLRVAISAWPTAYWYKIR